MKMSLKYPVIIEGQYLSVLHKHKLLVLIRKWLFAYAKTKTQISSFVFATWIVQWLYFLNPNFPVSNHILYSAAGFVSDLDRNLKDKFLQVIAQLITVKALTRLDLGRSVFSSCLFYFVGFVMCNSCHFIYFA